MKNLPVPNDLVRESKQTIILGEQANKLLKNEPIYYINREKIESTWCELFDQIVTNITREIYKYNQTNEYSFKFHSGINQLILLHSFVGEMWDSKHKIPILKKKEQKPYKVWGVLCKCMARMAMDICTREFGYSKDYNFLSQKWLAEIILEPDLLEEDREDLTRKKRNEIDFMKSQNKSLRQYENPFDRYKQPALWKLIQSSINSAERLDGFRRDYWYPFLKARSELVKELNRGNWRKLFKSIDGQIVFALKGSRGQSQVMLDSYYKKGRKKTAF